MAPVSSSPESSGAGEPSGGAADVGHEPSEDDTVVLTFRVPGELEGQRLDRFLEWRIPRLSRERAREIIEACARREDGSPRASWERVHAGEIVRLVRERFREPDAPREFGVIHEDPVLTIVDKPAGLPVHPSATYHRNTLTNLLRERYGEGAPHIAHRLDKETSGSVACAPPGPHEVRLKKQFEARTVGKIYLAIVRGVVAEYTRRIELPMRRATSGLHMCMETHPSGAEAITELEVLERRADRTLVRLTPRTGRQHQLRVHMAALGAPILHDRLYPRLSDEAGADDAARPLKLLARRLAFVDPLTGAWREFVSERRL